MRWAVDGGSSGFEKAASVGQAMLVAEQELSSRIGALMGSGVLLDAPRLKELVSYIEWVALPAAEAYERLLCEGFLFAE